MSSITTTPALAPDLDRSNLVNAYVTGMKEQVGFVGNDYTFCLTMYNADEFAPLSSRPLFEARQTQADPVCRPLRFIVGLAPSAFIISSNRVSPRVFLPTTMFLWSVLTIGTACEFLSPPPPWSQSIILPNRGGLIIGCFS